MTLLEILFKKHSTWITYVKSFGCREDICEDFVQEMYIKIYDYSQKKDNDLMYSKEEVNYVFIYITLKNLYYDNIRRNKGLKFVDDTFLSEVIEDAYDEAIFNLQSEAVNKWYSELNQEIESIKDYSKEKAFLGYIKFIYQKVFVEHISVSELSRSSGITYWSLRNTVLTIKQQINENR